MSKRNFIVKCIPGTNYFLCFCSEWGITVAVCVGIQLEILKYEILMNFLQPLLLVLLKSRRLKTCGFRYRYLTTEKYEVYICVCLRRFTIVQSVNKREREPTHSNAESVKTRIKGCQRKNKKQSSTCRSDNLVLASIPGSAAVKSASRNKSS